VASGRKLTTLPKIWPGWITPDWFEPDDRTIVFDRYVPGEGKPIASSPLQDVIATSPEHAIRLVAVSRPARALGTFTATPPKRSPLVCGVWDLDTHTERFCLPWNMIYFHPLWIRPEGTIVVAEYDDSVPGTYTATIWELPAQRRGPTISIGQNTDYAIS